MQALFENNLAWAKQVAHRVHSALPPSFDIADLEQIALIEHWRRVKLYDPTGPHAGVPYQAYAYRAVRGAVLMACRRRHYRDATAEELTGQHVDQRAGVESTLIAQERWKKEDAPIYHKQMATVTSAMERLSAADAYLVRRIYFDGVEVEALAASWGWTVKALNARTRVAVRALRKAGGAQLSSNT